MARESREVEVKAVGGKVNGKPVTQPARQTKNAEAQFGRKR